MSQVQQNPLETFLRSIGDLQEGTIDIARKTLGDGKESLQVSLGRRNLLGEAPRDPVKLPSPRRCHKFNDIEGFAEYLAKYGGENTVVFVDVTQSRMQAVMDEKSERGFEVVEFTPAIHPVFRPWLDLIMGDEKGQVPMRDFVAFIAQNRRCISEPNGKVLLAMVSQVRMSREVELHQGEGRNCLNGMLIHTRVTGGSANDRTVALEFPDEFTIKSPIYVGTEVTDLVIDLSLTGTEQAGVVVLLSASDLIEKQLVAFEWMENVLRSKCQKVTIASGMVGHQPWETIRC